MVRWEIHGQGKKRRRDEVQGEERMISEVWLETDNCTAPIQRWLKINISDRHRGEIAEKRPDSLTFSPPPSASPPFSLALLFCCLPARSPASSSRMVNVWLCDNLTIRSLVCACCYLWSHTVSFHRFSVTQWGRHTWGRLRNDLWHSHNLLFIRICKTALFLNHS